jgi:hypothetical protein
MSENARTALAHVAEALRSRSREIVAAALDTTIGTPLSKPTKKGVGNDSARGKARPSKRKRL